MFESPIPSWPITLTLVASLCSCSPDPMLPGDGGPGECRFTITSATSPVTAPTDVFVEGQVDPESGWPQAIQWDVRNAEGQYVSSYSQGPTDLNMTFYADIPGMYNVTLSGWLGTTECSTDAVSVLVIDPFANIERFRLHFLPAAGHDDVPAQDRFVDITGELDHDMGEVQLDSGWQTEGLVQTDDGTSLAAYIRASTVATDPSRLTFESFSDAAGRFAMRTVFTGLDYLIVPADNTVAPQRFSAVAPGQDSFDISPGIAATGTVSENPGVPVAGARVSLRVDDVPSTLATTDAAGGFALSARAGPVTSVAVVPPAGSGLLELSLPEASGATLDVASGEFAIAYGPGQSSRPVAITALALNGVTVAVATRATFIARPIAGAGTLTIGAGDTHELTGTARISLSADGVGTLSAVLPEAEYDVILEPENPKHGAPTLLYMDLRAGRPTPASLTIGPAARIAGTVRGPDGSRVVNASISAIPTGILTLTPAASASATSTDNGSFVLRLIPGGQYQLQARTVDATHVHARILINVPSAVEPTDIGVLQMGPSVSVTGQVRLPLGVGGAGGITIRTMCFECPEEQRERILSETITDSTGSFTIPVPDPGIGP